MDQWTLVIPAPAEWLTANKLNNSWSKWKRAELTRQWRGATVNYATQARLPRGLGRVRVDAVAQFWGPPPVRDRKNLEPTMKAVVDGLGPSRTMKRGNKITHSPGYGLIDDDDDIHLEDSTLVIGESLGPAKPYGPTGRLTLTITAVAD